MKEGEDEIALDFYGNKPEDQVRVNESNPSDVPMSPGKRILYYAGSPGRFVKKQIAPGSVNQSIFSLVIICLGAGTITIPYVFYELGFVLGSISILFGGAMSCFSGWLIAYGAHMTKGTCYEEIAMMSFGPFAQKFTCVCMIACNIGFTVSYIVLVRNFATTNLPLLVQIIHALRHLKNLGKTPASLVRRLESRPGFLGPHFLCKRLFN